MSAAQLRRSLHFTAASVLHTSGLLKLRRAVRRGLGKDQICVLGLHRVLNPTEWERHSSPEGMCMREETFAELSKYLGENFAALTLEEFLGEVRGKRAAAKAPRPEVLITFDDGWGDTAARAVPLMRERDLPATIFVTTGALGKRDGFWVEQIIRAWHNPAQRAHLKPRLAAQPEGNGAARSPEAAIEYLKHMPAQKRKEILDYALGGRNEGVADPNGVDRLMDWNETTELSRLGFDIGAHTVTHPLLTYEDDAAVERELRESREALETKLGKDVWAMAYPNGSWDTRIRNLTEKSGYTCAFTTEQRWYRPSDDRLAIPRVLLHEGNVTGRDGRFCAAMLELTLSRTEGAQRVQ